MVKPYISVHIEMVEMFPNIEFEDGSRWGVNSIKEIYEMDGRIRKSETSQIDHGKSKAILKITIDKSGKIVMYGSKNANGGAPFYPLKLINNQSITIGNNTRYIQGQFNNKIVWNSSGSNTIKISQKVRYETFLYGYVTGKKIVPCSEMTK